MSSDDRDSRRPGMASAAESRLARDIDALAMDRRLALSDAGQKIVLELDAGAGLSLPSLDTIAQSGESRALAFATPEQIEALLSLDATDLADEGGKLNRLLETGWMSGDEQSILRKGMLFMRNKMYAEAGDWWRLHAPKNGSEPFALVLQLMSALTWRLKGDENRARGILSELQPKIARLAGNSVHRHLI